MDFTSLVANLLLKFNMLLSFGWLSIMNLIKLHGESQISFSVNKKFKVEVDL